MAERPASAARRGGSRPSRGPSRRTSPASPTTWRRRRSPATTHQPDERRDAVDQRPPARTGSRRRRAVGRRRPTAPRGRRTPPARTPSSTWCPIASPNSTPATQRQGRHQSSGPNGPPRSGASDAVEGVGEPVPDTSPGRRPRGDRRDQEEGLEDVEQRDPAHREREPVEGEQDARDRPDHRRARQPPGQPDRHEHQQRRRTPPARCASRTSSCRTAARPPAISHLPTGGCTTNARGGHTCRGCRRRPGRWSSRPASRARSRTASSDHASLA